MHNRVFDIGSALTSTENWADIKTPSDGTDAWFKFFKEKKNFSLWQNYLVKFVVHNVFTDYFFSPQVVQLWQ